MRRRQRAEARRPAPIRLGVSSVEREAIPGTSSSTAAFSPSQRAPFIGMTASPPRPWTRRGSRLLAGHRDQDSADDCRRCAALRSRRGSVDGSTRSARQDARTSLTVVADGPFGAGLARFGLADTMPQRCPWTSRFGVGVVGCAAWRSTSRRPVDSASATARTVGRSPSSSRRTCSTRPAGTDIFQMPPGGTKLTEGTDALRCLRFSSKLLAGTPIVAGRSATPPHGPRFPVVAVVHSTCEADSRPRDEVLGPPLCRIYERSAVGELPPNAPAPASPKVFARRASKLIDWWVRGLARPLPFFDDRTKAPRAVPRVLTRSERSAP